MSPRKVLIRRTILALGILAFSLTAATLAWEVNKRTSSGEKKESAVRPLFPKTETAKNPVTLQLQADESRVVGWISGSRKFTGQTVRIKCDGKMHRVKVDANNTFSWDYTVKKETTAQIDLGKWDEELKADVFLVPTSPNTEPCVFFVVDRTAYRPGQVLHFAGFLRKEEKPGTFVPIVNQAVEVDLVSERKNTKAAKLNLTSDSHGRIVGQYTFSENDPLDNYTLSIPKYKGSAKLMLGEYRKSKIRLKIAGKTDGDKLKLTFEGLDFLDKPVELTKASFLAQVVRRNKEKSLSLKSQDFVYHEGNIFPFNDLDSLSEEDLLLWEAEGITGQIYPGMQNELLKNLTGEPKVNKDKPAEYEITLEKPWRKGDCAVIVQGVITDTNGREQRGSTTIPIEAVTATVDKKPLELKLATNRYFTSEAIQVEISQPVKSATVIVMKLAFQTPSVAIGGWGWNVNPYSGYLNSYSIRRLRYRQMQMEQTNTTERVRRTLVTAVPVADNKANLKLEEPGTYKLILVVPQKDGTSIQQETAIVVKRLKDTNPLFMRLDKEEFSSDEQLTGVIHSYYAGARALLTLRDSTGIRLTKPITFDAKGIYRLAEHFPSEMRYGCTVEVLYPDAADHAEMTQAFVRISPVDRMLKVKVQTPDRVLPGSTVDVGLEVDRKEEVDLVVSVYDQSLLGIAPDRSTDIRNFFLADERGRNRVNMAQLHRKIGNITLASLYDKAVQKLKENETQSKLSAMEIQSLRELVNNRPNRYLYSNHVATMLRLAGLNLYYAPYSYGNNWHRYYDANEKKQLVDIIREDNNGWKLICGFVGNTLLLHETHKNHLANYAGWHPIYGWNGSFGYGRYGYGGYGFAGYSPFSNSLMYSQQLQGARFDTWAANGSLIAASANSMYSFMPEGQGFISHMPPPTASVPLLDADTDQGHIAVRRDFSDSAFWNATVRTDANGKAKVTFKLPDSLTNWQVVVTAVSPKMHVGSAKGSFKTYKPIMVWPMLPRSFTETDRVEVFASVHNRTDETQLIKVRLKVENGRIVGSPEKTIKVAPKSNAPVYWTFLPGQAGFTQLLMSADAPGGSDASLKRLPVLPAAAEQVVTASGMVKKSATIDFPADVNLQNAQLEITFAPSLAADMADTLNYLVDYPYGCVEQTMSRFLPAIKVAQILRQFKVQHPELEKKLPNCVAGGIKRLLELQQGDGGWGWHAGSQTHEMMTPYALFGLLQAEKAGYQIPNESAIGRGLNRLENFINQMGDAQTADRVYCMYVFSHRKDLYPAWWTWLEKQTKATALSDYALGLALEIAVNAKKQELADELAKRIRERAQKNNGHVYWQTAKFSRWGDDKFEITAQVMKALVAYDKNDPLIEGALNFFMSTKRGNRWNSTKDTALILFALTDYLAKTEYNPQAMKNLSVSVNAANAKKVLFDNELTKKIVIPGEKLKEGKNTLAFDTEMKGVLYRAVFRYWKAGREIDPMDKGLKVTRKFHLVNNKGNIQRELKSGDTVPRGSYVLSVVEAKYHLPVNMRYVIVENPKASSGETVPADDNRFLKQHQQCTHHVLREDRASMTCFHLEETPQTLSVRNVFLAELSGDFMIRPARAELMYQTETTGHSGSFVLKVK